MTTPTHHLTTPQILTRGRTVLIALELALLLAIVTGTQVHREVMQHIGRVTAAGVIAAEKIRAELADMDADAADELLAPTDNHASGQFDDARVLATEALLDAAALSTPNTAAALDTLQVTTGTYERLIQQARDFADSSADSSADSGADSAQHDLAVRYYRAAGIVMDGTLLPAAADLDQANNLLLESRYESQSRWSFLSSAAVLLLGLASVVTLVTMQLYLSRRMHRTLNPLLAAATAVTILVTALAFSAMLREQSDLRLAKQDAFSSIRTLLQARATAYAANSDESRYLLDTPHADEAEQAFHRKIDALLKAPGSMTPEQVLATVRNGNHVDGLTGYLADELNNITFPGERDATLATIAALYDYQKIDGQIRTLERTGHHAEAIALDTGRRADQSNGAFDRLDASLGETIRINQAEFDRAVTAGLEALNRLEPEATLAALFAIALIFFGLAPRIREYS